MTMSQRYTHLTLEERYQIKASKKAGFSNKEIAFELDRHVSTINRELKRNQGLRGYRPKQAQAFYEQRHIDKPKCIKLTPALKQEITKKLKMDWSPEQIRGRLIEQGGDCVVPAIIYSYIRQDKANGGDLYKHLRHKGYRRRSKSGDLRGHIRNRVGIEHRPRVVELKNRLGDWEADTVIGKNHKGVLVTLTERRSRLTLIASTQTKKANVVCAAIIKMLKPYQRDLQTITYDNGKEFACHEQVANDLNVSCYFANPYSSWERGLNENHNGLIRQYLPKKLSFDGVTNAKVRKIQEKLNNRPKKVLGFKTPLEVYNQLRTVA